MVGIAFGAFAYRDMHERWLLKDKQLKVLTLQIVKLNSEKRDIEAKNEALLDAFSGIKMDYATLETYTAKVRMELASTNLLSFVIPSPDLYKGILPGCEFQKFPKYKSAQSFTWLPGKFPVNSTPADK